MDKRKGAILVCAGSVSHITQNQVQTLLNQENIHLVRINMVRLLEDKNSELIEKSRIINQLIKEQENILLATAQSDDEVEQAVEIGKNIIYQEKKSVKNCYYYGRINKKYWSK